MFWSVLKQENVFCEKQYNKIKYKCNFLLEKAVQ